MNTAREQNHTIVESANELINREIKKFNVSDAAIAELAERYLPMVVKGLEDKEGYQAIKAGRQVIKGLRIDVDKRRKELTADAIALQRGINKEAARITELLEPIENHLESQEKIFDDEKERIRIEKEQAKQRQFDNRLQTIMGLGFVFNGFDYKCAYSQVVFNNNVLTHVTDESFQKAVNGLMPLYEVFKVAEAEKIRLEREQKAEEEKQRLYQIEQAEIRRKDAEAENLRIAEENKKIAAENARLQAELIAQKKLSDETAAEMIRQSAIPTNTSSPEITGVYLNEEPIISQKTLVEFANQPRKAANDVSQSNDMNKFQKDQTTILNYMQSIQSSSIKNFQTVEGEQFYKYLKTQLNDLFANIMQELKNLGANEHVK